MKMHACRIRRKRIVLIIRRDSRAAREQRPGRRRLDPVWEAQAIRVLTEEGLGVFVYDDDDGWDARTILAAFAAADALMAPHGEIST